MSKEQKYENALWAIKNISILDSAHWNIAVEALEEEKPNKTHDKKASDNKFNELLKDKIIENIDTYVGGSMMFKFKDGTSFFLTVATDNEGDVFLLAEVTHIESIY